MVPSTMKISTSDGTIDTMQRTNSTPRLAVRTSFGSAGTFSGQMMLTMKIQHAEQPDQNEARDERAGVHVADRAAHGVGEHDQHQRRRDDLGDGAGGGDDAGRDARVVAVARHHRQRDQPHGDDRGRDRAGDRAEQRADEDDRIGEAAAHRAEQLAHRVEQVLGQAAALEDRAHEGEERDRQQQLVRRRCRRCARAAPAAARSRSSRARSRGSRSPGPPPTSENATG